MSNYIGNQPSQGEFKRLDAIASSFDGSTTQFNLTYNSVSQTAGDASQLIVSLNGIIQEPLEAYTLGIGGNSIIFASAPASGDTCHIVLLGGVGQTTTPTDGSVTASKLDAALKDYYEDEFTASGGTDYTLSREAIGVNQLMVTIDGIVQPTSAYSASGTTLTISPALPTGTNIRVVHMGVKAGVYVPQAGSVGLNELDVTALDARYYQSGDSISVADINFGADGLITQDGIQCTFKADTDGRQAHIMTHDGNEDINLDPSGYIQFEVAGQERMRINSSGYVGIGTPSPDTRLVVGAGAGSESIKINAGSGWADLILSSGTSNGGSIKWNDGADSGEIFYYHGLGGDYMRFNTNATERMRIDSSGNLLVGTTDSSTDTAGIKLRGDLDLAAFTKSAGHPLQLNRLTSDGDLVQFRKNGSAVGSIGTATRPYFASPDWGVKIGQSGAQGYLEPTNQYGSALDAQINMGASGTRWKDLYLSGGVYVGGTTSANYLDDYEEGTFTLYGERVSWDEEGNVNGTYTKVGNLVFCSVATTVTNMVYDGQGSGWAFYNFPFTIVGAAIADFSECTCFTSAVDSLCNIGSSLFARTSRYTSSGIGGAAFNSGAQILKFTLTYRTT